MEQIEGYVKCLADILWEMQEKKKQGMIINEEVILEIVEELKANQK